MKLLVLRAPFAGSSAHSQAGKGGGWSVADVGMGAVTGMAFLLPRRA